MIDFFARSADQRRFLMQRDGDHVQQSLRAGRGAAAGLLDQPGDRIGFVDQTDAAGVEAFAASPG